MSYTAIELPILPIILAAGKAQRMGTPKCLVEILGQNLLDLQVDWLRKDNLAEPLIVVGDNAKELQPHFSKLKMIVNPHSQMGPFSSILTGIRGVLKESLHILILPIDVPYTLGLAEKLWMPSQDQFVVVPSHKGRGGHPVLLTPEGAQALLDYQGEPRLDSFQKQHLKKCLRVEITSDLILENLNTQEDVARFSQRLLLGAR